MTSTLAKLVELVCQADWSKHLTRVEYALNNTVHSTTKKLPSELLFGVAQRGPEVDSLTEYLEEKLPENSVRCLNTIRKSASDGIIKSQIRNERKFLNKNYPPHQFSIGDYVVMRNTDTSTGSNKKLIPKYRGPYVIHKVLPHDRYIIRDIENCQLTQLPYNGVIEASRLRLWKDERIKLVSACL